MKRTIQRVKFSTQRSLLLLAALISSAYLSMVYAEGGTASDTIVICVNESLTLTSSYTGAELYHWYSTDPEVNGATTPSVTIDKNRFGVYDYKVVASKTTITAENNLMKNGDFETLEGTKGSKTPTPTTFGSDYTFAGWLVQQWAWPNYYVITDNAKNYLSEYFCDLPPHGGSYYALFDAGTSGFAWKSTSANNPNLKLIKDSVYIFSYWVAEPNKFTQYDNYAAQLQFFVQYEENGENKEIPLGEPFDTKNAKNKWVKQEERFTAPATSNNVVIGVRDSQNSTEGNDFCLDDIMFQTLSYSSSTVLFTDSFIVKVNAGIYRKWDDFLFVDNSDSTYVTYQWYVNGQAIEGATEQYYRILGEVNNTDEYYCIVNAGTDSEVELCHTTVANAQPSNEIYPYQPQKQEVARRSYALTPEVRVVVITYSDGTCDIEKQLVIR